MRSITGVLFLGLGLSLGFPSGTHAQGVNEQHLPRFTLQNPTASQLSTRKLQIAPGMELNLGDYVAATNMRERVETRGAFTPEFRRTHLLAAPDYREAVEGLGDRLKVVRTLKLKFKNPCDRRIPKELKVCFKPTGKKIAPGVAAKLAETRGKYRAALRGAKGAQAAEYQRMVAMSDPQLLDALLNAPNEEKIIVHTSVVPFVSYKFGSVPMVDLTRDRVRFPAGARMPMKLRTNLRRRTTVPPETNEPAAAGSEATRAGVTSYVFNSRSRDRKSLVMGWTLGRQASDTFEVQFARGTRFTDRYYARFSYTLSYGLGIRLPMEVSINSSITHVSAAGRRMQVRYPASQLCEGANSASDAALCASRAEVTVTARGVDGSAEYYERAGVPRNKIFGGKEFVLEAGVTCRLYASIPGPNIAINCPSGIRGKKFSKDFTPYLGRGSKRLFTAIFPGRPLGLGIDAGLGYAVINPGARLNAENGELILQATGWRSDVRKGRLVLGSGSSKFSVAEAVEGGRAPWGVVFGSPKYRMRATLMPMMEAEIGIDLGVYRWSHKFGPYGLGALKVNLGSYEFGPHEGTQPGLRMQLGVRAEP